MPENDDTTPAGPADAGTEGTPGQAPGSNPPAGAGNGAPGGTGQEPTGGDDLIGSLPPEAQDLIRQLRSEAAGYRTKLRSHEEEAEQRRQAELSELERERETRERLEGELTQLRERLQAGRDRQSVTEAATKLGFKNPTLAFRLLDLESLERDGDGNPTNVDSLLRALLQADPYLAAGAGVPGDAGAGRRGDEGGPSGDMNAVLRRAVGRG